MTLIAKRLALIGTDFYVARFIEHFGKRQIREWNLVQFPAIKESHRWATNFLPGVGGLLVVDQLLQGQAFVMNLMTT